MNGFSDGLFFVLGLMLGALLMLGVDKMAGHDPHLVRVEAVEAGVAEWVVIDSQGNQEFRWITTPAETPNED